MTPQHILYIPIIFLLGYTFGKVTNLSLEKGRHNHRAQLAHDTNKLFYSFILFIAVLLITHAFEIPWGSKELNHLLNNKPLFDHHPTFTSQAVYQRIATFPAEGITAYKRFTHSIDLLFPAVLFFFLFTFARFVQTHAVSSAYLLRFLPVLSILWLASDLAENTFLFTILHTFPREVNFLAGMLGYITLVKFSLLLLSATAPSLLLLLSWKKVFHQKV